MASFPRRPFPFLIETVKIFRALQVMNVLHIYVGADIYITDCVRSNTKFSNHLPSEARFSRQYCTLDFFFMLLLWRPKSLSGEVNGKVRIAAHAHM